MTLAELKRKLQPGAVIYCSQNVRGEQNPPLYRRVIKSQTNSIACVTSPGDDGSKRASWSWLYWPKAGGVREIPGGFEIDAHKPEWPKLRYLWEVKA
jgi:hypothetical protein